MAKVGGSKVPVTPAAPVDRPTRIEQEKFQLPLDIGLDCEIFQPDRRSLHVRRSVLVHDDYVVFKDAYLARPRIAGFTVAA